MYTEGTKTTEHHQFLQHNTPCRCPLCVRYELSYPCRDGMGYRPASTHMNHSFLDCRRDIQAPRVKDVRRRGFIVGRVERSGHRSPQRRPVFAGPGPCSQSDNLSQIHPWELNPAQWSYPPEPGVRHYPSVREHCGCVVQRDARAHPFISGLQPLPHLQVKGRDRRHKRTVRYVSVEEEEEGCACSSENCHMEPCSPHHLSNGHCGPRPEVSEGGEERDNHRDGSRLKGGSEEGSNGSDASHKVFFSTEVPQKHLNQSRQKRPCVPEAANSTVEPLISNYQTCNNHQRQGSEVVTHKRGHDFVREQIRQVVTDLEDVLGGLKQVHVEMKEVVEQIDRLTANIDLSEGGLSIAELGSDNSHGSVYPGDLRLAKHKSVRVQVSEHRDEERIILRTDSPSPVHMASVVKTSRIATSSSNKDVNHDRHDSNGYSPHLYPHKDSNHISQSHPPQSLNPKVIIGSSTSSSKTHKPPPYPQNGRCGKGQYTPPQPVRNPSCCRRGQQSTSMV
ncbi:uncharacterized protein LOC117521748 [Thalassophryne amazonica]|uniref:uncharacterized protein LOC117521748 n=1 Tax=Thalassophryne amazonica TaxID=390379 RepID=UPI001471643A|nr:uncharacterized protein LOC117521748 [Thalassophryne amazonica]XP_034038983.1 uncharacterized protein LOC117521748 [Thalassophryne amazonica]